MLTDVLLPSIEPGGRKTTSKFVAVYVVSLSCTENVFGQWVSCILLGVWRFKILLAQALWGHCGR